MIIKEVYEEDEKYGNVSFEIYINGNREFCVHDGEPEDNTLFRNFNDCLSITSLLEKAYQAGKAGEELIIDIKKNEA